MLTAKQKKHIGENPILDETDEEHLARVDEMLALKNRMHEYMTRDELNAYKRDRSRIKNDRVRRETSPVACKECAIRKTCMKRKARGLTCCPCGIIVKK